MVIDWPRLTAINFFHNVIKPYSSLSNIKIHIQTLDDPELKTLYLSITQSCIF